MKSPLSVSAAADKGKKFSFSAKIGWRALINSVPNTALRSVYENIRTDFAVGPSPAGKKEGV
jgi:hypothetical protein